MRDVFSNASKDQPRAKLSLYEPSLRDSREFRELILGLAGMTLR